MSEVATCVRRSDHSALQETQTHWHIWAAAELLGLLAPDQVSHSNVWHHHASHGDLSHG